jgi:hypothetical protein
LAAIWAAVFLGVPAFANEGDELQRQFILALALMEDGAASEAVVVLHHLYARAPTPRIRLELARALFLAGDLAASRQLFLEAYNDAPPADVRANIVRFIGAIDQARGKLSVSGSVAHYANPLQQPGTYSLNFAGIDLTFEPDSTYRNLWGAVGTIEYQREFASGLNVSASASYRELPGNLADRFIGDASIGKSLRGGEYEVRAGLIRFDQPNQSFTLPFMQGSYAHSLSSQMAAQPTVRVGYFAADAGAQSSGWQVEAILPLIYSPEPSKTVTLGPTVTRQAVGFSEQSFTSLGLRGAAALRWDKLNLDVTVQARTTRFDDIDPFWGERRKDKGVWASVALSSDSLRFGPFLPAVGVTCDFNRSTIRYFQQGGCDTLLELRRAF